MVKLASHRLQGIAGRSNIELMYPACRELMCRTAHLKKSLSEAIPFNPLDATGPEASPDLDSLNIGGLGIHLVKKMMDDIDYQRDEGKNKLILKKCVAAA